MGEMAGKCVFMNEGYKKEKWANHYSSNHRILLVGEGDFSFSLSLAVSFQSASKIVATSLDSYDDVIKKYKDATINLWVLGIYGAQRMHGVDATTMTSHIDLQLRKFDRIIYNFPHAGFFGQEDNERVIKKHQSLVNGFFNNASQMLRPNGEIHVTHKTTSPFNLWNIEELAVQSGLTLLECVDFNLEDYRLYKNKRGASYRCDEPFPLGKCSTFKFAISSTTNKPTNLCYKNPQKTIFPISNTSTVMNCGPVKNNFSMNCGPVRNNLREYFDDAPLAIYVIVLSLLYLVCMY